MLRPKFCQIWAFSKVEITKNYCFTSFSFNREIKVLSKFHEKFLFNWFFEVIFELGKKADNWRGHNFHQMQAFCQINTANTSEKLMCKTSFEEVKNDFNLLKNLKKNIWGGFYDWKIGRKRLKNEFKIEIEITEKLILKNETARQNSVDWSEIFPSFCQK